MIEKFVLCDFIKTVFIAPLGAKPSPEDKKDSAKDKKSNQLSFSEKTLLGPEYVKRFNGNLDEIWERLDADKNKMFDKEETKKFLEELQKIVDKENSGEYDPAQFEKMFGLYDEDKNGFLEKAEMAVFIKKVFKKAKK